jgi:hypothetical protein
MVIGLILPPAPGLGQQAIQLLKTMSQHGDGCPAIQKRGSF